jgi:hypothetical protein
MAGFENSLRAASTAILRRELTESERVEFLELAGAIGMDNVKDYLYMLMVFKRNEDRVNGAIAAFKDEMAVRFGEMGALEKKIHDTLESSISRVLGEGAREIGQDMGREIAAEAKATLTTHEEFHYLRGQCAVVGFVAALSTVVYWLGSQFGFERIGNESFFAYLLNLRSGFVVFACAFGYAYFWSVDRWKLIRRDWFYTVQFVLQILISLALLVYLL